MIKGYPQTDGDALFCARSAPRGRVVGRMRYAPTWYLAKFAGVRRRPYAIRPYRLSAFRFPRRLRRESRPM